MSGTSVDAGAMKGVFKALSFAAKKHRDQRRKDSDATPYINHPIAVAEALVQVGGVADVETLQAALLHDTLEDTATSAAELTEAFGAKVSRWVEELSDNKAFSKEERKRLEAEHAPTLPVEAKLIKLADKLCNLLDISRDQPANWELQRKLDYFDFAERVVAGCRGHNAALEQRFDEVLRRKRSELNGAG